MNPNPSNNPSNNPQGSNASRPQPNNMPMNNQNRTNPQANNPQVNNPQNIQKNVPQGNPQQQQNKLNPKQLCNYQEQLRIAYEIYNKAEKDYKNFLFTEALEKYDKASNIVNKVYPNIVENEWLKNTTDKFKAQLEKGRNQTTYQIKHRYDYKPQAGFAVYPTVQRKINYFDNDDDCYVVRRKGKPKPKYDNSNSNPN